MRSCALLLSATLAACGSSAQPPVRFEAERAMTHVRRLVEIGPRPAGSPGNERARAYISEQLKAIGISVEEQAFEAKTPLGPVGMVNLQATIPAADGGSDRRILLGSHYDTKLFREFAFVGANDGGSSTGFLLEFARVLKQKTLQLPIELVFFDGEEAVVDWHTDEDNTYGSRHYVEAARRAGSLDAIGALILVDMVGDRDLTIRRDPNSTPWLTDIIWSTARRLQRREFVTEELLVEDDHLPFVRSGIPAVDIIDFEYPAWHTADDTIDKLSPASLQVVGDVLVAALPDVIARVKSR